MAGVANAMDFKNQVMALDNVGNAETIIFPGIRSAVVSNPDLQELGVSAKSDIPAEGLIEPI